MRRLLGKILSVFLMLAVVTNAQDDTSAAESRRTKMKEVRRLVRSARDCFQGGDAVGALAASDSVVVLDKANPDASYYRALSHLALGDTTEATTGLEAALASTPLSSRLKILLARMHLARKRPAEAAELLDHILALRPNEGEALFLKGRAMADIGDTLQALDLLQRAIETEL